MDELIYQNTSQHEEEDLIDPFCDPSNPKVVPFEEVLAAKDKIKDRIVSTPCVKSRLSEIYGMDLYLKKELMQFTGNFKERGACYAMLMLTDDQKKKGVVSASSGNYAQAICYHGLKLGIPVTVVMPVMAPLMKISQCKKLKGTVIVQGLNMAEAKKIAIRIAKNSGMIHINGYDHPNVIAGQGTIGLEILEQVPDVDAVVAPCGGGGLLAGVSLAIKTKKPSCKIIACEAGKAPGLSKSLQAGKPTLVTVEPSLADGLSVPLIGFNAFATAKPNIDKMAVVKEESLAISILRFIEIEKCVVEGAGACSLAAVHEGHLNEFKGKKVVLVISGGNIDTTVLGRCLERGLAAEGRLIKTTVTVSDRPGGVSELLRLISSIGVNIKDVIHERAWITHDVFSVDVTCTCEARDAEHAKELQELLNKHYKKVITQMMGI